MKFIVWPYGWPHISRRRTWRIADGPLIECRARGRTTHQNRYSTKWSSSLRNKGYGSETSKDGYAVSMKTYGCSDPNKTVRTTASGIESITTSVFTADVQDIML